MRLAVLGIIVAALLASCSDDVAPPEAWGLRAPAVAPPDGGVPARQPDVDPARPSPGAACAVSLAAARETAIATIEHDAAIELPIFAQAEVLFQGVVLYRARTRTERATIVLRQWACNDGAEAYAIGSFVTPRSPGYLALSEDSAAPGPFFTKQGRGPGWHNQGVVSLVADSGEEFYAGCALYCHESGSCSGDGEVRRWGVARRRLEPGALLDLSDGQVDPMPGVAGACELFDWAHLELGDPRELRLRMHWPRVERAATIDAITLEDLESHDEALSSLFSERGALCAENGFLPYDTGRRKNGATPEAYVAQDAPSDEALAVLGAELIRCAAAEDGAR